MTDEMIMEAVKNGDLQQVSMLFERYHKRIFNFLARMTMDRELAEDLTQNVFLRIMKYRASYRKETASRPGFTRWRATFSPTITRCTKTNSLTLLMWKK